MRGAQPERLALVHRRPPPSSSFLVVVFLSFVTTSSVALLKGPTPKLPRSSLSSPQFAPEADLPNLRRDVAVLERDLSDAISREDFEQACVLRDRAREMRTRDPQHRLTVLWKALQKAIAIENYRAAAKLHDELLFVKRHVPQYQLAGLWRGLYPRHGEETIRVRYDSEDPNKLIATKITGDANVPRGQITFTANVLTMLQSSPRRKVVRRITSNDGVEEEREVTRFAGSGQVAGKGFQNPFFVDGELFLLDASTIGFLWIPLGGLIIFNRVDGREAEMIEEIEAERGADPNYELDRAWDLAQNADVRLDGTGDGTAS